jgi:hypothetical protein
VERVLGTKAVEPQGRSGQTGAEDILAPSENQTPVVKTLSRYLVDWDIEVHSSLKSSN